MVAFEKLIAKEAKMSLKNKVALVTGSTSGIGLGIAEKLAESGFHIMIHGFANEDVISKLKTEMESKYGVKVGFNSSNLIEVAQIYKLVDHCQSELGSLDVLVNNAGMQFTSPLEEFPNEKWDDIIALNLSAAFHATKAVIPQMKKAGWGRIVNIASTHGLVASVHKAAYVAAKHGLIGLTKVTALELAESGITCNAVCPGWVRTPLVEKQIADLASNNNLTLDAATISLLEAKQPTKRFTEVSHLGDLVSFLVTDAASNMTGAELKMDGAWTAQ